MIDYTLNVAVGISAGIGALVSAVPGLQPYTLWLCLGVLGLLAFINLRGLRESGLAFMPPTYLFVGCLVIVILLGVFQAVISGGHPHAVLALPPAAPVTATISLWLFLKAFAAGCTAMTGVEAVSNGVQAFREPVVGSARKTLILIVAILILLLIGVAYLVQAYHINATDPGSNQYQSILSLMTQAVVGRGFFYFLTMASVLLVLCLSANTSFADFPRVCRTIAQDGYLPYSFMVRGRRLVFTEGVALLTTLSGILLIVFNGVTDRLIPLFAVGAFLAFTLSQTGMVMHWLKKKQPGVTGSVILNAIGAFATGVTFFIVIVTKFAEGAWVVLLVMPGLYLFMLLIHHHYTKVGEELALAGPIKLEQPRPMIAVIPIMTLNSLAEKALQIAYSLSEEVSVIHIERENGQRDFCEEWERQIQPAISRSNLPLPHLEVIQSPFRRVVAPTLDYIWRLEKDNPDRTIAVLIPQLIESHWYYNFLHNQRARILRTVLLLKGLNRIVIVNVPWHMQNRERIRQATKQVWEKSPAWLDN
jgi:amino acid transporter